jgi:hypothetical protein
MERFSEDRLPFLGEIPPDPLPEQVPAETDQLGEPVTSISFKGDGIAGRVAGVFLILSSLSCLLMPPIVFLVEGLPKKGDDLAGMGGLLIYVLILAPVGIWLVFFRKWTPRRSLWVCPGGLIWEWGSRFGFKRWHEIEEFSASGATGRPLFWVTPAEGTNFVLSAGQGPTIVPIADYIELKASGALLPISLKRFVDGETLMFGKLRMDQKGIRAGSDTWLWHEIKDTRVDGTAFLVKDARNRDVLRLRTRDVSFPMVAQAIVRLVTEEGLLK